MNNKQIIKINKYPLLGFIAVLSLSMGLARAYNYETTTCTSSTGGPTRVRWVIAMDHTTALGSPLVVFIDNGSGETHFTPNSIATNFQNTDSKQPFRVIKMWSGDNLSENRKSGEELVYKGTGPTGNQSKWGLTAYSIGVARPEINLECHTDYQNKGPNLQDSLPWDTIDKLLDGVAFFLEDDIYTSNMLGQHNSAISYSKMYGRCYDESNKDLVFWWDLNDETKIIKTIIKDSTFKYRLDKNYYHVQAISNNNGERATYSAIYKATALFNPSLEFWEIRDGRASGRAITKMVKCKVGELSSSSYTSDDTGADGEVVNSSNKRPRVGS